MPKENIWNVPNMLTILRLLLIPLFIAIFAKGYETAALFIFLLASLTDFLDGYIARRSGKITRFGKLMDPLADKLMTITVLICLTASGRVPIWVVIALAAKELLMLIGGLFLLKKGEVVQAKMIGKVATVLFMLAVVLIFFQETVSPFDLIVLYTALVLSVLAMLVYGLNMVRMLRREEGTA